MGKGGYVGNKEKEILKQFEQALVDALEYWAGYAAKFYLSVSAAVEIVPLDVYRVLRQINDRLSSFRNELSSMSKFYKDLEDNYGLKPLSFDYLNQYALLTKNVSDSLTKIKEIAQKYKDIFEAANKSKININTYVNNRNQKALERLLQIDVEKLLDIIADNDLLGF